MPLAVDVKAFSEQYGELQHSVNGRGQPETILKEFGLTGAKSEPGWQIALLEVSTLSSQKRS